MSQAIATTPLEILTPGALSLVELKDYINQQHELVEQSGRSAVEHAFYAGEALIAAKDQMRHGEWLPWLKVNFDGTDRMAERYMKIARNSTRVSNLGDAPSIRQALKLLAASEEENSNHNHRAQGTGENEWYTPIKYIEAARQVMGEIDLDPATSEIAQQAIKAAAYFTKETNGLDCEWSGRVWLNPPYAQPHIYDFTTKLVAELTEGRVTEAILLTHNYTDTAWFHIAEEIAAAICFTRGRIKFVDAAGEDCSPTQGQAFFYYGPNTDRFNEVFRQFGFIR